MIKYLFVTCFIVLFDQISKYFVKSSFEKGVEVDVINSFLLLQFNYIENPGIVFGISVNNIFYYIVIFISLLIVVYIYSIEMKKAFIESANLKLISFSFILGGAIGNIIDRFFVAFGLFSYKGVIDFIHIGIEIPGFLDFTFPYIFNIADASVTIGIILFIYSSYSFSISSKNIRLNDEEE